MPRIVVPSSTDWLQSADFTSGTVLVQGRLAEMLYPGLWRSCVGAWSRRLDALAVDASGSGNGATHTDRVVPRTEAWELFGALTPGHFTVADRDNLDFGEAVLFSGAAWVKFDAAGLPQSILSKGDINNSNNWSLIYDTTANAARFLIAESDVSFTNYDGSTDIAADGLWHHVAFTVSSRNATPGADDVEIYVDGVAEGTLDTDLIGTDTDLTTTDTLLLGSRSTSGTIADNFNGLIADVSLHRRALAADEVAQLALRRGVAYECRLQPRRFFFN